MKTLATTFAIAALTIAVSLTVLTASSAEAKPMFNHSGSSNVSGLDLGSGR